MNFDNDILIESKEIVSNIEVTKRLQETVNKLCYFSEENWKFLPQNDYNLPSITKLKEIIDLIRIIIFPGYFGSSALRLSTLPLSTGGHLEKLYELLNEQLLNVFTHTSGCSDKSEYQCRASQLTLNLIEQLPEIRRVLETDVKATFDGDPASKSFEEIIFAYPTIRALINYRIAHSLHRLKVPLLPRIISEQAHSETGIDIHPGAQIGEYFCIDHGTGVVIGETCIIGNRVKIFQGVTLGAKKFSLDDNGFPIKDELRHPIIEDNVIIYSNSSILGRITIGKNSIIGGNIWLTHSISANSVVLQKTNENDLHNILENTKTK